MIGDLIKEDLKSDLKRESEIIENNKSDLLDVEEELDAKLIKNNDNSINAMNEALRDIADEYSAYSDIEVDEIKDEIKSAPTDAYVSPLAGRTREDNRVDYYPDYYTDEDILNELETSTGEYYDSGDKRFSNMKDALDAEISWQKHYFIEEVKESFTKDQLKAVQKAYASEGRRDWQTALAEDYLCVSFFPAVDTPNCGIFQAYYEYPINDIKKDFNL